MKRSRINVVDQLDDDTGGRATNRYSQLIEDIFFAKYSMGDTIVPFERTEIENTAARLGIALPKNLGDVVYSFKYRTSLPEKIRATAPEDQSWVICNKGRSKYALELRTLSKIRPDELLPKIKIPDATPGIVARYALDDEQALLTKLRYNRLIDTFTGVTCYSIQNHLRTTVDRIDQVETDEIYVGVDKRGAHYVFPVQAKGGNDVISVVQIEQDIALCHQKFPALECRAIAAQFMANNVITLFEFGFDDEEIVKLAERHYVLVPPETLTDEELLRYRTRPLD
ncbi:MAG: endonuclease [Candidatus Poribacteria bacterium]|nr:endonuclease [Candidatus Poribacteria bacterium]